MNVAYILNNTIATNGDTKAFLNLLQSVIDRGIHPFVIMPDKNGIYHELERNDKVKIKTFNYRTCAYPRLRIAIDYLYFVPKLLARIIVNWTATRQLTAYLKENAIDIVHTNVGVVRIGFDAAQKNRIPHIYHIREYRDKDFNIHYFPSSRAFYQQLDKPDSYSICITKDIQHYHRQSEKSTGSRVIYDGVFRSLPNMPIASSKNYFLFAGRIQPAKGVDFLLEAYKIYAEKAATPLPLKIAGSCCNDDYSHKLLTFVKDNGLSELVEFLGDCKDITSLMREARSLIVSSPFEGFGFCMPEAQQQGCLVIARNTGGTKEQLDNALQMTGREIALRYSSVEELAAWLTKVAEEPQEQFRPYTELAFKVVNQLYTKENNSKQIYIFYQDILNGKGTHVID